MGVYTNVPSGLRLTVPWLGPATIATAATAMSLSFTLPLIEAFSGTWNRSLTAVGVTAAGSAPAPEVAPALATCRKPCMPPSGWFAVVRLNCRSNSAKLAGLYVPGALCPPEDASVTSTSCVLPAVSSTWFCSLGLPGARLPSSATTDIGKPTIDGMCVRRPALSRRTSTLPLAEWLPGTVFVPATANADFCGAVLSKACPLMRK